MTPDVTREAWLTSAIEALQPLFIETGIDLPPVRVSCGFPKGSARKIIGQCWPSKASADGQPQLFISPTLSDASQVLAVLVHELVHAADDCKSGHKGAFTRSARSLGLEGKMTATVAGAALATQLAAIACTLGGYPHSVINLDGGTVKKQTTRMLKVECGECGYTVRTTAKWLEVGVPLCPCNQMPMEAAA